MRTAILTLCALVAFAANSILCRLALGTAAIDPASFTTIRLASGALVLALILAIRSGGAGGDAGRAGAVPDRGRAGGNWPSALALFLYAAPFSFSYVSLGAATGALVLFGAVQATMIAAGLRAGDQPHRREWIGLLVALGGFVVLVAPGLRAPSPVGCALMALAGVAWGVYSLRGRDAVRPIAATAGNFLRAAPLAILVSIAFARAAHVAPRGALLATLSGAVTSGLGYVIWYAALRGLTATRAATVQLAVPVLTAFGGVALLGEPVTLRLAIAAALILGGVGFAVPGLPARADALPIAQPPARPPARP